jgi:CheY-like chemotaxis protein
MKNAILIVDDSRLNRETLADILKDKYNIIEAEDGRSGLEVLERRKDDIVLVILDIVMPGMDGFAFMEEARITRTISSFLLSRTSRPLLPSSASIMLYLSFKMSASVSRFSLLSSTIKMAFFICDTSFMYWFHYTPNSTLFSISL